MTGTASEPNETDDIQDLAVATFFVILAQNALKAAMSEDFRNQLHRRRELREELAAPEWVPYRIEPYWNISTWRGRLALWLMSASAASPFNWFRYAPLRKAMNWAHGVEIKTRWEEHEDWPGGLS